MKDTEKTFWFLLWMLVLGVLVLENSFARTTLEIYPALDPNEPSQEPAFFLPQAVPPALEVLENRDSQVPNKITKSRAAKRGKLKAGRVSPKQLPLEALGELPYSGNRSAFDTVVIEETYDRVPPRHITSISKRMAIVQEILLRHHRAYDYRVFTTEQLERILLDLDASLAAAQENF